MLKELSGEYCL